MNKQNKETPHGYMVHKNAYGKYGLYSVGLYDAPIDVYRRHFVNFSAEHKSLNAAICLALAEAVTGEKQTLEV